MIEPRPLLKRKVMEVKLAKKHAVLGKKGKTVEVPEKRAAYLQRIGAIEHSEPVDADVKKPKKEAPKKSATEKEVKVIEPVKDKTTKKK